MKLYCEACNQLHHFSLGAVERIIYTLEADARSDPGRVEIRRGDGIDGARIIEYRPDPDEATCLNQILEHSFHPEMYLEHVEAQVERRRDRENPARVGAG